MFLMMNKKIVKRSFESCITEIDAEIKKRSHKWQLTAIPSITFDDVSQIIRLHIYKKFPQYNQSLPLAPWINRIISNQIKNLLRNLYGNFASPCSKCAANQGSGLCSIYNEQGNSCPLYAAWEKNKKAAHDSKMPLPLSNHEQEVYNRYGDNLDIEKTAMNLHEKMKSILKPLEWRIYKYLWVDHLPESDIVASFKIKTLTNKNFKSIKKMLFEKAKELVHSGEIDFV